MNCPYCMKKMQKGILRANGNIRWMPLESREPLVYSREKYIQQGAVLFPPFWDDKRLMDSEETTAYICPDCKKLIIDFSLK